MIMKLSLSDLRAVTGELKVFYSSFSDFFRNRTRSVLKQAFQYLQGQIMVNERGNMTNIEKVVPDCNHQSLQHFISIRNGTRKELLAIFRGRSVS